MREKYNIYINKGLVKYNIGQFSAAITAFDQAITINPKCAVAYSNRGIAKANLGQFEAAIADFDQAITIKPQDADAYINRGNAKTELGQPEAAIADFDQAITINPRYAGAFSLRGIAKANLGLFEAAIADFDQAITISPQDADAYINRGNAKTELGQPEAAIADFDQAITIRPQDAEAYINRGNAMTKLRQFEAAIADYNQAININPQHEGGYYNRGNAKTMLRQFEAAILDYDQAITINPQLAHAYCGRGNAKYYLRQFETAISDYCLAIPLSLNLLSTQNHNVKATHLLKFREINARNVDSIRNRQVWFAHPNTFSDKTDGKYLIELFPENNSIQQIVSSILVYSCFGISNKKAIKHEEISLNHENIMWADYGNGGKGICLHYQYSPENAEKTNEFSFDEISYVETIKRDENVSLYDTLQHGFFTKHSDFKFENENRFITVADGDAIYKDTKLMGKSISEASLGIKLIAIDFGTDCSEEDKKKVFDVINARADSTSISFYQLNYGTAGSFTFNRTAISR